jgi:hypothetical protein
MVSSLRVACACNVGLILVACGGPKSGPTEPTPKPAAGSLATLDADDHHTVVPVGDGGAGSPSQPTVLVRAPGNVGALALDDEWVYWIDGTHGLARTSKRAGGAVSSLTLIGAGSACCGVLAVDAANVYWAIDSGASPKGLRRTSKAPEPVPAEHKADVSVDPSSPACLAADADAVYWLRLKHSDDWARGGSVVRAAKRGGAQKVLAPIETPGFGCIAVDSSNLYLAAANEHHGEGAVRSVPKTGGPEKTIASLVGPGVFLQVDDEHVYWADAGGIVRARKTGGARSILTETPKRCTSVAGIALDDAHVYFSCEGFGPREDSGTVWRVAKRGGAPMLLAEGQVHPSDIAVDHDFVYWSSRGSRSKALADGNVERLAKPAATHAPE